MTDAERIMQEDPSPSAPLAGLTEADWARLLSAADFLCLGDSIRGEDLLQEALARHLAGERAWNPELSVHEQIRSTMRSVLHAWRKARVRAPHISFDEAMEASTTLEGGDFGRMDAESEERAEQVIVVIEKSFANDGPALDMLSMMMDGYTRAEICELAGWTVTEYATIKKRIHRQVDRLRRSGEIQ